VREKETYMKLVLLYAVGALIVVCVKGFKRNSKDKSASSFQRWGL